VLFFIAVLKYNYFNNTDPLLYSTGQKTTSDTSSRDMYHDMYATAPKSYLTNDGHKNNNMYSSKGQMSTPVTRSGTPQTQHRQPVIVLAGQRNVHAHNMLSAANPAFVYKDESVRSDKVFKTPKDR
jgi:hypothetical protein